MGVRDSTERPKFGVSGVKDTAKTTQYFTCMQHEMPQSLLVFAVSLTPETPNFRTLGGITHPPPLSPLRNILFFIYFCC